MTTPATMNRLLSDLRDRIKDAKRNATESGQASHNSFGAGYDQGYLDALTETFANIAGDQP